MIHGLDSNWPNWMRLSACLSIGTDAFFPVGNQDDWGTPRKVCMERCYVRLQCLDNAMNQERGQDHKTRFGIIGGLSPIERKNFEPEWLAGQEGAA